MSEDDAEQLDQMLSNHVRRRLDPQLGRASAAFEATAMKAASAMPVRSSRRWVIPYAAGVGGLIAAAVLLAWPLLREQPGVRGVPHVVVAKPTSAKAPDATVDYERFVMWRAVDEGAQVVESDVPVRKLRYEAVEQIQWDDPDDQATIQLSVPVAQVVLVQQPTF